MVALPISENSNSLDHSREGDDPSVLSEILRREVNLAVWRRSAPPWWGKALRALLASDFEEGQWAIPQGVNAQVLRDEFARESQLEPDLAGLLGHELAELTLHFLEISELPYAGVRLERIRNDQCRAFHVDRLHLRLITTLCGPGTLWIRNPEAQREHLGHGRNDLVLKESCLAQEIPSPWVGLLKGEAYPGNTGNGIIHRSPAIEGSGIERIVLRIDALREI